MSNQSVALKTFIANVEELEHSVKLLEMVWSMSAGIDPTWSDKNRFYGLIKQVDKSRLLAALFLVGHAAFEDFLRKSFTEVVQKINSLRCTPEQTSGDPSK